jgi:hypothetical protein
MAGSNGAYSQWENSGKDLVFRTSAGTEIFRIAGDSIGILHQPAVERTFRTRVTTAQVNAGLTLLPAIPGYKYRMTDMTLIAVGGAATTATAVIITATQAASGVSIISAAVAALTQSAVVKPHTASVTVLADGASFVTNDVNTAIAIAKTGSSMTVATAIDVVMTYAIET